MTILSDCSPDLIRAKKRHCYSLIRQISTLYGGDDKQWLKDYAIDLIERQKNALDELESVLTSMLNMGNGYLIQVNLQKWRVMRQI